MNSLRLLDHCRINQICDDNVMHRLEKVLDWLDRAKVTHLKLPNFFYIYSVSGIAVA